ncbi:MAG: MATE family efflux transporter [Rhodospirillaceae bacterium]|nr:MATE family efflux transporter [Rhodospirillaceae bacterium]
MANVSLPLTSGPIWRPLLALSGPNIVGTSIQSAISITEAWFLGGLGHLALAGVALVFPIYMLANMLSAGAIGGAVAGAAARARGAGDDDRASSVLRVALVIAIFGSLTMTAIMLVLGPMIFRALGGQGVVLALALEYSETLFSGILLMWLFNMAASVLRGSGDTVRPARAMILIAVSHILLSFILVRGAGPIPGFGMQGAAVALVVSYGLGAGVLLAHLFGVRSPVAPRLRLGVDWAVMFPILRSGLLAGSQSFLTVLTALLVTAIVGRLGAAALAGYGVGVRLELMMVPVIFGFGGAMIAMAGANVGAGNRARAIAIAWRGSGLAGVVVGGIGILFALFPDLWSGLFTTNSGVMESCRNYLRVVGPFYVFFGVGLAVYFASQGLNTLFWPVMGTVVRLIVVCVVVGGVAFWGQPTETSVFWAVAIGMVSYGVFNCVMLRFGPWRPQVQSIPG